MKEKEETEGPEKGTEKSEALKGLEKGDLIVARWTDASDKRARLEEHIGDPGTLCKDWGIYLGATGTRRQFLLIGKDIVEVQNQWGATRIPLELVEDVQVILPRIKVLGCIREVLALGRKVMIRKRRREAKYVRVA